MKKLLILSVMFLFTFAASAQQQSNNTLNSKTYSKTYSKNPIDYGFTISQDANCPCASKFFDTKTWYKTSRGSYYCIATSRNTGNKYKRYFSNWISQKKRKDLK